MDGTAPHQTHPPYREVRRLGAKWEGPEGENGDVHLRRLAKEAKKLREKYGRRELWEEGIESSINTSDFMHGTDGRANICTLGFTVDTEVVRCGPHLTTEYRRCKAKQRLIAEREAVRPDNECVRTR
jgi:hypothetical protein